MKFRERLTVEVVGDEVLVLDPDDGVVHRLSGEAAQAAISLRTDGGASPDGPGLAELRDAGLLDDIDDQAREGLLSRRRMLAFGGMVAGLGVVSVALPPASAASSPDPGPTPPTPTVVAYAGLNLVQVTVM